MAGKQGPVYSLMKEYALNAARWGTKLEIIPYIDERIAAEDFKAGQCDGVLLTGIRARQFNQATGSIDSIGGLPNYRSVKLLFEVLAKPEASKYMIQNNYEVAGLLPLGAAYLFLRDRQINSVAKMAGRKLAVLGHDQAQIKMSALIGAQAVASDVTNFAGKFNNGIVDVVAAPAIAYMPLELYKGVGTKGVVLKLPVAQLTLQLVLSKSAFDVNFAQQSREYFNSHFDDYLKAVLAAEDDIYLFFPPPDGDTNKYIEMMREARIKMLQEGIYHPKMLALMKRVRCKQQAEAAECTENRE
ncbi:MAG TPA: DUF6091 family protein [Agitococcus sp.]|nr:DUF6091 family protein [Agitococcus sp.]